MAITTSRLTPRTLPERSSSFDLPSGFTTDLSKSNSTSAAKVTFSATGFGFGGGSAGFTSALGVGAGAGAGAGAGGGGAGLGGSCVAHPAAKANANAKAQVFFVMFPPVLVKKSIGIKVLREGRAHSAISATECPNDKTHRST